LTPSPTIPVGPWRDEKSEIAETFSVGVRRCSPIPSSWASGGGGAGVVAGEHDCSQAEFVQLGQHLRRLGSGLSASLIQPRGP
jgi:hypothetical protein